jgi:hypothetical protein
MRLNLAPCRLNHALVHRLRYLLNITIDFNFIELPVDVRLEIPPHHLPSLWLGKLIGQPHQELVFVTGRTLSQLPESVLEVL